MQQIKLDNRGQVIVEYVLLLILSVIVAVAITTGLVSRDPNSTGIVTKKWSAVVNTIGADFPGDAQ